MSDFALSFSLFFFFLRKKYWNVFLTWVQTQVCFFCFISSPKIWLDHYAFQVSGSYSRLSNASVPLFWADHHDWSLYIQTWVRLWHNHKPLYVINSGFTVNDGQTQSLHTKSTSPNSKHMLLIKHFKHISLPAKSNPSAWMTRLHFPKCTKQTIQRLFWLWERNTFVR